MNETKHTPEAMTPEEATKIFNLIFNDEVGEGELRYEEVIEGEALDETITKVMVELLPQVIEASAPALAAENRALRDWVKKVKDIMKDRDDRVNDELTCDYIERIINETDKS